MSHSGSMSVTMRIRISRATILSAAFLLTPVFWTKAAGQTRPSAKSIENQMEPLRQLILDNRIPEAERLVRTVLPVPEAEHPQNGGFFNVPAQYGVNTQWAEPVTKSSAIPHLGAK